MSDVMLFGVLRMPYEMAMGDDLSRIQFYERAQEAADRIEALERELAERKPRIKPDPALVAALEEAAKTRSTVALLPDGEPVFINYGDQPEDTADLCCTACGGSGHIEDQQGIASRAEQRIAELERELKQARLQQLADIGQDIERELAERKPVSIDSNQFRDLLAKYASSTFCGFGEAEAKADLIAYIDGRTEGETKNG